MEGKVKQKICYYSRGFTTRKTMKKTKDTKISNKIDDLRDFNQKIFVFLSENLSVHCGKDF